MVIVNGNKLRQYMNMLGWSADDLARKANLDKGTVLSMLKENPVRPATYRSAEDAIQKACIEKKIDLPEAGKHVMKFGLKDSGEPVPPGVLEVPGVVVNCFILAGDRSEWPPERVAEFIGTLQGILNRKINIEDVKFGSIKLFLDVLDEEMDIINDAIERGEFRKYGEIKFESSIILWDRSEGAERDFGELVTEFLEAARRGNASATERGQ